jgi:hypothetical protein
MKHQVGLLTVIAKTGAVTAQTLFDPIGGTCFRGNSIWKCISYGAGAITFGTASRPVAGQMLGTPYVRMLTLDAQARRVADHSSPASPGFDGLNDVTSNDKELVLLCGGDMHESDSSVVPTTRLLRLDDSGLNKGERIFRGAGYYLSDADNMLSIALVFPNGNTQVRTLDAALKDVSVMNGPPETFYLSTRSYRLKDGAIVLFGQTEVSPNSYSDSVTWINPTLRDREVFMFAPRFANDMVRAVTASERPNEFVTARGVHPRGIPGSEADPTGLMLTVLKVQ